MKQNDFLVDKRIREKIGTGRRIYNLIIGILLLTLGLTHIIKHGFSIQDGRAILNEVYILMGVLVILIGIVGREPFRTRYRLIKDDEIIRIKKSFESEAKINLCKIKHLKFLPLRVEVTYNDFVKSYDLDWLTTEEYENFRSKLTDYCLKNKIIAD